MSFLAPLALAFAAVTAATIVALHLLTTRRPPAQPLPTARFVPMDEARAVARTRRPTDLLLLALRVLAVVLIGAAFARPVLDAPGPRVRSVVLLDVSGSVASPADAASRAREALGDGSALIVFDTAARLVPMDSIEAIVAATAGEPVGATAPAHRASRGALSPALAAARRAAGEIARGADSVRLVVVSPFLDDGVDAATSAWRAAWPGRVETIRVAARVGDSTSSRTPELLGASQEDPLIPAVSRIEARTAHAVRILRRHATPADSAWVSAADRVLVAWPVRDPALAADAVHLAGPGGVTLVAPLGRSPVGDGRVVARWRDGTPAITERAFGRGCLREVGVVLPRAGDLTLREPFRRFLDGVTAPCGGPRGAPLADSIVTAFAGGGPLAPARLLATEGEGDARLPATLLALALLGLLTEWWLRQRRAA